MRDSNPSTMRGILTLRQHPAFADADLSDLASLVGNASERIFEAGEVVAEAGWLDAIYFIVEGELCGGSRVWPANQLFGVFEVIAGRGIPHRVVACTRTRAMCVNASDFSELLEDCYSVLHSVRRALARRLLFIERTSSLTPMGAQLLSGFGLPDYPLGMVERLIVLRQQMQFAAGRAQALAALAQASEEHRYTEGATLGLAGELAGGGVVILEGVVRATRPDGQSIVYGPGDGFGGLSTMAGIPLERTFEAMTPVRVLFTPARAVMDIMEDHTDYTLGLIARMAGKLLDLEREPSVLPPELAATN
jgi:CRP-like cAMP-binding protein